ncbi:phosphate ABC transporter substrate-binding protein PstS family protein [Vibrio sp. CK2-1]|uniref:PstS family phosphate ABC transporter substrate-binding protein n=1 Tax=Vibrio sp. CK2-1 TaxID=2912249 RepID=UPI001F012099|nr:phosphate ABC transporter substrate-binding protein PstS family protein [Vibrio sp. CK2-1]MCF7355610.1 phosphate ABC transporter substrate-binding protein PstS family protein [Vibrio sp. CK2-1]
MRYAVLACLMVVFSMPCLAKEIASDELDSYHKVSGMSGTISSVGSDTLATLTSVWAEDFQRIYPNINMQLQSSGSSTAPTALTEGTSQLGPMSRPMKAKELEAFERQYGYPPVQLKIAIDAIGIFVHKDNPIEGLNFSQVDAIFSSTLKCGATAPLNKWQQLGINTEWAKLGFQLFGRNSVSGTYGYFKQHALCKGDFKRQVNEQPGSASVVQSVASSINSIGYSGVGYQVSKAKLIPIALEGQDYIYPTRDNILDGRYPLARYLYVYVNKNPLKPLPRPQAEFLKFIYSKQGQRGVEKDGYVPLSRELANAQLQKVGLR